MFANVARISRSPVSVDPHIAADAPPQLLQLLQESADAGLKFWIVGGCGQQYADAPHVLALLRAPRERPRSGSAAEERDEVAASIKKIRSHGTVARVSVGPKYHHPPRTYCFHPARVG